MVVLIDEGDSLFEQHVKIAIRGSDEYAGPLLVVSQTKHVPGVLRVNYCLYYRVKDKELQWEEL